MSAAHRLKPASPAPPPPIDIIEHMIGPVHERVRELVFVAMSQPRLRIVREAARLMHMEPRALARICVREGLPPPKSWVVLATALKACAILEADPQRSPTELAWQLGYADAFSLSSALRRGVGMRLGSLRRTPRTWVVVDRWVGVQLFG